MHGSREDGGGRDEGASRAPSTPPSSRVQLEVAFLDADQPPPTQAPLAVHDGRTRRAVLVVAAEPDFRRYVRECLRERTDLLLIEAATITAAVTLAANASPDVLIVDEPEREVLARLSQLRAVVIVDDVPHGASGSTPCVRMLARPFTAEGLVAHVARLLQG